MTSRLDPEKTLKVIGAFIEERLAPLRAQNASLIQRVAGLENQITALRAEVTELKARAVQPPRLKVIGNDAA